MEPDSPDEAERAPRAARRVSFADARPPDMDVAVAAALFSEPKTGVTVAAVRAERAQLARGAHAARVAATAHDARAFAEAARVAARADGELRPALARQLLLGAARRHYSRHRHDRVSRLRHSWDGSDYHITVLAQLLDKLRLSRSVLALRAQADGARLRRRLCERLRRWRGRELPVRIGWLAFRAALDAETAKSENAARAAAARAAAARAATLDQAFAAN